MSDSKGWYLRVFLLHKLHVVEHVVDVVVHRIDVGSYAVTFSVSHCRSKNVSINNGKAVTELFMKKIN